MSWNKVKLSDFLTPREYRFKPNAIELKGLKRIEKINFDGNIFLSDKPSNTHMILIKKGDLVISGINVHKGAIAVYEGKENIIATIHYSNYVYNRDKIDISFLKLFLKSPEFLDAIKEQVPGGIKTEIKPKHLLPLEVVIPDIDEQRRICKKFSSFEILNCNLNTGNDNQKSIVSQLRKAFLREAMQGKLVPQDPNDEPASELLKNIKAEKEKLIAEGKIKKQKPLPEIKREETSYEIPESWVWCRLGEVIDLISGQHIESNNYNEKGIGFPYLTGPSDFGVKYPKPSRWTDKPKVFAIKNDILLTVKGAGVGKTNISYQDKLVISRQLMAIRPLFVINEFIHFYIINSFDILQSEKKGTGIPGIARENITERLFPLPPLSEQQRIVSKLDELMHLCDEIEKNINQSKGQTNLLLQTVLKEALKG